MADDWNVGDLALCVGHGADDVFEMIGGVAQTSGPIIGLTYTVRKVTNAFDCYDRPGVALALIEIPNKHPRAVGYNAEFFRKVEPYEADEEDFATIGELIYQPSPVFTNQFGGLPVSAESAGRVTIVPNEEALVRHTFCQPSD